MASPRTPAGLSAGGRDLWRQITGAHELDAAQTVTLLEACRAKDRLDLLDASIRETPIEDAWRALVQANATATVLKQLLASMRLPDANGVKPQRRGMAHGVYPAREAGNVSAIDRARARKSG